MGKHFDLDFLHEDESAQILDVLEKDFQLRMQEKTRLSKIKKRINEQDRSAQLLANRKEFNENCCIRCFRRFMMLLIPRIRCFACGFNVCTRCCNFYLQFRDFVCVTCQMEKDVMAQSCDWFYETVQRKFRQSGSAKVVRRLSSSYKRRKRKNGSGKDVPVTGRMRASVLSAFPDESESHGLDGNRTPRSSEDEEENGRHGMAPKMKSTGPENSQREVLRRMKSLQISRFHERMGEAIDKISHSMAEAYPQGFPSTAHRIEFRKFIHKSRDDLMIILKNFSQILAITIESHNLALGRTSENVHVDIQYILQDEVEGIVSRRIDVISFKNFDDSASFITDEGSRSGMAGTGVESKLAVVILRKILDDHRASFGGPRVSIEEEEMLREFDSIIDNTSTHSFQKRNVDESRRGTIGSEFALKEMDPDFLSLSHVSDGSFGFRPRSEHSPRSGGSGTQWLAGRRPVNYGESPHNFERGRGRNCEAEVLSEFSSGEQELTAVNFDCAAFSDTSGPESTPWMGTSSETEKKFLLQQLHQHQETDVTDKARVKRVSRSLIAANHSVTGAALDLESSAGQYVPATALRKTSDHSIKSAARVLTTLPVSHTTDADRAQIEEDVDKIQARIGTTITLETSPKSPSESAAITEEREHGPQPSSSNSDVAFGYRPPSRNAWDEYKMP